jgi:tetratricopeptide (TPR) repeat protein
MNQKEQMERIMQVIGTLNNEFPENDFENWETCNRLIAQTLFIFSRIKQFAITTVESAQLLNKMGLYLFHRARYQEAEDAFRYILADKSPVSLAEIGRASCNLAELLEEKGHYTEGLPFARTAYDVLEKLYGDKSLECAQSNRVLAMLYESQGNYLEAINLLQQSLEITEDILGDENLQFVEICNNLGNVYSTVNQLDVALKYYDIAKSIREKILPGDHPALAKIYNNIGTLYERAGMYDHAYAFYKYTLSVWERANNDVGSNKVHPEMGLVLNNLGLLSLELSRLDAAESYFNQAISILNSSGIENPYLVSAIDNLGLLYQTKQNYTDAVAKHQQAYVMAKNLYGNVKNLSLARILGHFGLAYYRQNDYVNAEKYYRQSLEIQENSLGKKHVDVAETMLVLSKILRMEGNIEQANNFGEVALAIWKENYGDSSQETQTIIGLYQNSIQQAG